MKNFYTSINLNLLELKNPVLHKLSTAPTGTPGQQYYNSTLNTMYYYNGTTWVSMSGGITAVQLSATPNGQTLSQTGTVVTIGNDLATQTLSGAMSSTDKLKLDSATALATPSTIVQRDATGGFAATAVTGLALPVNDNDAASKIYVDTIAQGLDPKASVRAISTTNITLSGAQTIDGVALTAGQRVLVTGQTTQSQNGIYVVSTGAWTRAIDANAWLEFPSSYVWVEEGTTYGDSGWYCPVDSVGTLETTPITYVQFSGAGMINAGTGMTKTGNTLNVNAANTSIIVNADNIQVGVDNVTIETVAAGIQVKDSAITPVKLNPTVASTGLTYSSTTGLSVTNYTPVTNTTVARVYRETSKTVPAAGTYTVVHNLAVNPVAVQVFDSATKQEIMLDITNTSTTSTILGNESATTLTVDIIVIG